MSEFKHNDCKNTTNALFSQFMKTVRINLQELQQFFRVPLLLYSTRQTKDPDHKIGINLYCRRVFSIGYGGLSVWMIFRKRVPFYRERYRVIPKVQTNRRMLNTRRNKNGMNILTGNEKSLFPFLPICDLLTFLFANQNDRYHCRGHNDNTCYHDPGDSPARKRLPFRRSLIPAA